MGLLVDDRTLGNQQQTIALTETGNQFFEAFQGVLSVIDLSFKDEKGLTWEMTNNSFVPLLSEYLKHNASSYNIIQSIKKLV